MSKDSTTTAASVCFLPAVGVQPVPESLIVDPAIDADTLRLWLRLRMAAQRAGQFGTLQEMALEWKVSQQTLRRRLDTLEAGGWLVSGLQDGQETFAVLMDGTPGEDELGAPRQQRERSKLDDEPSADVLRLCTLIADLYFELGNKRPNPEQREWHKAMRLLLTKDGPDGKGWSPEQVETIIRWSLQDEFWRANIRSAPKLRVQFDKLRASRRRDLTKRREESDRDRSASTGEDWMNRSVYNDQEAISG